MISLRSFLNRLAKLTPNPCWKTSDFLECQARHFGVEKVDQDPAGAADSGVEAKGAGWSHALHHGQEGRRDDDVGAPAGTIHMCQLQS